MKPLALALLLLATPALAQTPPAVPPPPVPAPETWLPRQGVDLTALDKVTARVTQLSGRIGQTLNFGSLVIIPRACIVRGPDQPADQAVYLDITDSRAPDLGFHGWMLLSAPALSMLAHPVYDIRLAGCRA
jgi:hypothetical protein